MPPESVVSRSMVQRKKARPWWCHVVHPFFMVLQNLHLVLPFFSTTKASEELTLREHRPCFRDIWSQGGRDREGSMKGDGWLCNERHLRKLKAAMKNPASKVKTAESWDHQKRMRVPRKGSRDDPESLVEVAIAKRQDSHSSHRTDFGEDGRAWRVRIWRWEVEDIMFAGFPFSPGSRWRE